MAKVVIEGLKYRQFGHEVLFTEMPFKKLCALVSIDQHVQRELDSTRRQEIKNFILNLLDKEEQLYFAPFIFSARGGLKEKNGVFYLDTEQVLYISDGQHRHKAMEVALLTLQLMFANTSSTNKETVEKLKKQIDYLENYKVPMQIYLQLDVKLERQLFSDLNTERHEAQPGQLLQYDRRDTYSVLTRQIAQQLEETIDIELKSSRVVTTSSSLTTLVTMKRCLIALFEGSISTLSGKLYVTESDDTIRQIGLAFFKQWLLIFPQNPHDRDKYVSGLSGIQVALARTVYKLVKEQKLSHLEAIAALSYLKTCTWRHTDPLFKSMYKLPQKKLIGHSSSTAINRTANVFFDVIQQEMAVKK